MANTGNTQQQINYGNTANDGLGDPLRTAFIKTDDNFDAIWNTGPVGSNITILNNTIQANNTNGNIVIRPNGVGMIQANASILPNADGVRDLGGANLAWRRVYADTVTVSGNITGEYVFGNGAFLTGIANGGGGSSTYGNANVSNFLANGFGSNSITSTGNISAGNLISTGNLYLSANNVISGNMTVTDTRLHLGFGTANAQQANLGGVYLLGTDAALVYVTSEDFWVSTVGFDAPNLVADNIMQATTVQAGNVYTPRIENVFPVDIVSNNATWQFAQNILRDPEGGSWAAADNTIYFNSPANGFVNISSLQSGNVVSEIFMEHSFIRFLVDNGAPAKTWQMGISGEFSVPGDIIPQSNGTASLGNATNRWSNITGNNIDAATRVSGAFMLLNVSPLNNLPPANSAAGLRGFANDANLAAAGNFGAEITDGGSNVVPVWSDGSVWRIG